MLKILWRALSHRQFTAWQHNSLLESNQSSLSPLDTSEAFGEASVLHRPGLRPPIVLSFFRNPRQSQNDCTNWAALKSSYHEFAAAPGSRLEFRAREAHRSEEKGLNSDRRLAPPAWAAMRCPWFIITTARQASRSQQLKRSRSRPQSQKRYCHRPSFTSSPTPRQAASHELLLAARSRSCVASARGAFSVNAL